MLKAYLDESGIHQGSTHFVLAGFIAGARKWVQLERLWVKYLAEAGVDDFHAKHFFKRSGPYQSLTEDQMERLCQRLVGAIKPHGLTPVGGIVPLDEFFDREEWQRRILTGGIAKAQDSWFRSGKPSTPYFLVFPFVLVQAVQRLRAMPQHLKVDFVFDVQDQYKGLAELTFSELKQSEGRDVQRLGELVYSSRRDAPLLGVADLLAHLLYLEATGTMTHPVQKWTLRQVLLRERQNPLALFDASSIEKVLPLLEKVSPHRFS